MPPMLKILLVRLSSMGDIIHTLPSVSDLATHYPNAALHWVAEEGFADLPALHPRVAQVLPFALRRWRRQLTHPATRAEMAALRDRLQAERYDLVIDSQGLLKSAITARLTGSPVAGYDRRSIREPLASLFYHRRFTVSWQLHAAERCRALTGRALGYTPAGPVQYGLQVPPYAGADGAAPLASTDGHKPYAVLLTATSRDDKLWPEAHWVALGQVLAARGLAAVLPWGNPVEQARASRIASSIPGAQLAPRLGLREAAGLLAGAACVVGVDTGLVHLATAVGTPTVALYVASDPALNGVLAPGHAVSLGKPGQPPQLTATIDAALAAWESR